MSPDIIHALEVAAIVVAGTMTGAEFSVAAFVHPRMSRLEDAVHARMAKTLASVLGAAMPFWYHLLQIPPHSRSHDLTICALPSPSIHKSKNPSIQHRPPVLVFQYLSQSIIRFPAARPLGCSASTLQRFNASTFRSIAKALAGATPTLGYASHDPGLPPDCSSDSTCCVGGVLPSGLNHTPYPRWTSQ